MKLSRLAAPQAARRAFTLMEVLVVVAIIVVLAGIGLVAFRYLGDAKENACRAQIKTIENAVSAHYLKYTNFPATLDELTEPPPGESIPAYLEKKDILDPWGKPFSYDPSARSTTGKPKIFTESESGKVISNW